MAYETFLRISEKEKKKKGFSEILHTLSKRWAPRISLNEIAEYLTLPRISGKNFLLLPNKCLSKFDI